MKMYFMYLFNKTLSVEINFSSLSLAYFIDDVRNIKKESNEPKIRRHDLGSNKQIFILLSDLNCLAFVAACVAIKFAHISL